jgi:hypothetical protein
MIFTKALIFMRVHAGFFKSRGLINKLKFLNQNKLL